MLAAAIAPAGPAPYLAEPEPFDAAAAIERARNRPYVVDERPIIAVHPDWAAEFMRYGDAMPGHRSRPESSPSR